MADKLSAAQQRRADLETLDSWAKEQGVDDQSLMLLLKEIALQSLDGGYRSEKVCVSAEGGVVLVTETFPTIAVSAIGQIHKIAQDARKEMEKEPPADPVININVGRKRLEDVLKDKKG